MVAASAGCTVVGMAAVATAVEVVYLVVGAIAAGDCTASADLAVVAAEASIVVELARSKDQVVAHPIVAVDTVTYISHFLCRNIKRVSIIFIFSRI